MINNHKITREQFNELLKPSPPKPFVMIMGTKGKEMFDKTFKELWDDYIITGEARIPVPKRIKKIK